MTTTTKLTKTRIVKWLESKKAEQLIAFDKETKELLKIEKMKILSDRGLLSYYKKWQPRFNKAFKELDILVDKALESGDIDTSYRSSSVDRLRNLSGEQRLLNKDLENMNFTSETYENKVQNRNSAKEEIQEEWNKLIAVVRSLNSAKKIKEYLSRLSIDLTEVEDQAEEEVPMLPSTDIRTDLIKL